MGVPDSPTQGVARRLRTRMDSSVLAFPLTPFDSQGRFDADVYRAYLEHQLASAPGALFVACGTGEFAGLDLQEYARVVRTAVDTSAGRLPVVAGAGYGTPLATAFAAEAEQAGADAILLLPPSSAGSPQEGLFRHIEAVAGGTALPLIAYQRDNVAFTAETLARLARVPGVIGLKDGHGDLDRMQRLVRAVPEDFLFFNGTPTAELQARAYAAVGVPAYSSAVHAVAPEIAVAFHTALSRGDNETMVRLLDDFYIPWVTLRDEGVGYAVSLVKAAARERAAHIGVDVGPVRAPLVEPSPEHLERARALLAAGLRTAAACGDGTTATDSTHRAQREEGA